MFYNSKTIKFDLIIYNVMNKEHRIFAIKKNNVIMFIHRNNKNKQFVKGDFDDFNRINRETYVFYKVVNRKFKHFFIKY